MTLKDTRSQKPLTSREEQSCGDVVGIRASTTISAAPHAMKDPLSFESLYESVRKCQRGVLWKDSVAAYSLSALERTVRLKDQLDSGKYASRPPYHFLLTRPKKREAASICFRDRVYQRSLNDNILYPALTRSFVYDNGACQKGKGTDFVRKRLKRHLEKAFREWGTEFYVLQCDIKGYYPNMDHASVEKYFRSHVESKYAEMAIKVLREQYPGEKGYNPGSQMLQLAGISMLNPVDHFIKERLRIKYYTRYMDDFILLHSNKDSLERSRGKIAKELVKCKMVLHPTKTKIFPVSEGIYYLGFNFVLTESGKVVLLLSSENVKSERRHLRHLVAAAKAGRLPRTRVDECYQAWKAHASKGNTHNLLRRMDAFYTNLW